MTNLDLRDPATCAYDVLTLGEVMLRLDPGEGRVRTARTFTVTEGGGEYNVGRALRRVFGHRVATVTAIGDSDVGRLLEDLLLQGGTALDHVVWKPTDAVGREHRTPLNFTERGFGLRAPAGVYDRAHSAAAALGPDDVDWEHLFGELGVRWFHTGGIFAGLSESTFATVRTAVESARRHGTVVSYDVNYRPSLWRAAGGADAARALTADVVRDVDVLFGEDPDAALLDAKHGPRIVAATRRVVHSASDHGFAAVARTIDEGVVEVDGFEHVAVLDRVGSGDAFAAGVIHGVLTGRTVEGFLRLGVAHGALVMSTPGDTSSATLAEVERAAESGTTDIDR